MSIATFDGNNKIINLNTGVTLFTMDSLYSDWKRWVATSDNSKFLPAFRYVGGDPTIPGQSLGTTYFLLNGWKIRPYNADHTLIVEGNIFTDDQSSAFMHTIGDNMVVVQIAFSNLTTTVVVDSSGSTVTPESIATAVWSKNTNSVEFDTVGTIGSYIKNKVLTVSKYLGLS
jgi:hypothetical protein